MKIDNIDIEITKIMEEDGRISISEIASKLAISEGTARNRFKKLTDNSFMKVKGLVNPDTNKKKQSIYILITLQRNDNWLTAGEKMSALPDVKSVSMVTGSFHFIVELFIDPHNLIDFLTKELPSIGEIAFTESLVTVKNFNKWV